MSDRGPLGSRFCRYREVQIATVEIGTGPETVQGEGRIAYVFHHAGPADITSRALLTLTTAWPRLLGCPVCPRLTSPVAWNNRFGYFRVLPRQLSHVSAPCTPRSTTHTISSSRPSRQCFGACPFSPVASTWPPPKPSVSAVDSRISEVPDYLDSLVDKSLVVTDHSDVGTRYRLLEPVRQFAQEQSDVPPTPGYPELPASDRNMIMHIELPTLGDHVLQGTDALASMGHTFTFGNNTSITSNPTIAPKPIASLRFWLKGAKATKPLAEMFWGGCFGTPVDRFGVQWIFNGAEKA